MECQSRAYEDDPTISEEFQKLPRTFRRILKYQSLTMRLGSMEDEQNTGLFPSKLANLGKKSDFNGLFFSQIRLSSHSVLK